MMIYDDILHMIIRGDMWSYVIHDHTWWYIMIYSISSCKTTHNIWSYTIIDHHVLYMIIHDAIWSYHIRSYMMIYDGILYMIIHDDIWSYIICAHTWWYMIIYYVWSTWWYWIYVDLSSHTITYNIWSYITMYDDM